MGNLKGRPSLDKPKIDMSRVLTLRLTNKLSMEAIAKDQGVTKQAISAKLKKFEKLLDAPHIEDNHLAQLLKAAAVEHLCAAVDPGKVKKLSADKNSLSACMLLDKARLVSGQSTSNQSVFFHIVAEACEASVTPSVTLEQDSDVKT